MILLCSGYTIICTLCIYANTCVAFVNFPAAVLADVLGGGGVGRRARCSLITRALPLPQRVGGLGSLSGSGAKTNVKSLTADFSPCPAKSGAQHTTRSSTATTSAATITAGTSHSTDKYNK